MICLAGENLLSLEQQVDKGVVGVGKEKSGHEGVENG
jgi:hypothetical protein